MGKTSFLLNYYARHLLNKSRKYNIELIDLGAADTDQKISKIAYKEKTVLFLDALNEDVLAIVDPVQRIKDLVELTKDFLKIIITCRTKFFPEDEEISGETGQLKIGPPGSGESGRFTFHKIYLSPFSEEMVEKYIKHRYNILQPKKRKKAFITVEKISNLVMRPMFLSCMDLLIDKDINVEYPFQLYEEIVTAWVKREEDSFRGKKKETLRKFCNRLAVDLHVNKVERKAEKISISDMKKSAVDWGINSDLWRLTDRSLLILDAEGNYKFSNRSIMEYLVVHSIFEGDDSCYSELQLTDLPEVKSKMGRYKALALA